MSTPPNKVPESSNPSPKLPLPSKFFTNSNFSAIFADAQDDSSSLQERFQKRGDTYQMTSDPSPDEKTADPKKTTSNDKPDQKKSGSTGKSSPEQPDLSEFFDMPPETLRPDVLMTLITTKITTVTKHVTKNGSFRYHATLKHGDNTLQLAFSIKKAGKEGYQIKLSLSQSLHTLLAANLPALKAYLKEKKLSIDSIELEILDEDDKPNETPHPLLL